MDKNYSLLGRHDHWLADNSYSISRQPERLKPLVNHKGSLTSVLIALADGDFEVNLLGQKISLPYYHEQIKLRRPLYKAAMVREVELVIGGVAVVYARSIVPLNLVSKGKSGLANLGRTPLGHLLFKDGKIRVSKREFATIDYNGTNITARRTPYDYQGSVILVAEFFLPSIEKFID